MSPPWSSRLLTFAARLLIGIVLGPVAAGIMLAIVFLVKTIHPLDRWHTVAIFGILGEIAGIVVGVIWGIGGLIAPVKPPSR